MRNKFIFLYVVFIGLISCSFREQIKKVENPEKTDNQIIEKDIETKSNEREYNFKFIGFDINIDDPAWDRRSYYKIYIDKIDAGRTSIGLESQKKTFEYNISNNRHLLEIEKWALDEKKGQYIKLNNIEQPKPNFTYFELPADKAVIITLKNDPFTNKSEFDVEYE